MALSVICVVMAVVIANLIYFIISTLISRSKLSTSFLHGCRSGTGYLNTSLLPSLCPRSPYSPLPLIASLPVFPPLPEVVDVRFIYRVSSSLGCSSIGVGYSLLKKLLLLVCLFSLLVFARGTASLGVCLIALLGRGCHRGIILTLVYRWIHYYV